MCSSPAQTRPGTLQRMLQRLFDPKDVQAATTVALALLTWEAAICPLIVWAVPCAPRFHLLCSFLQCLPALCTQVCLARLAVSQRS